jgi:hypothetical protein
MANTLNGINLAQIAQETLDYLKMTFAPLNAFSRDFSSDIAQKGASVSTRVASSVTAGDLSGGYTPTDVTSTAKTVTLSNFKGFVFGFTDLEVTKAGDPEWLKQIFIVPAVESLLNAAMSDAFALVLNANYATNVVAAASAWDADAMVTAGQALSTNKVPRMDRHAILPPTYTATLFKDTVVQSGNQFGSYDPVQKGQLNMIHGIQVHEFTGTIPANAENLAGFVAHPSAMCMAARQIATPQNFTGQIVNVTDPETKLPIQFRTWYDHNAGKTIVSVGSLYGFAVGNGSALYRIKSA